MTTQQGLTKQIVCRELVYPPNEQSVVVEYQSVNELPALKPNWMRVRVVYAALNYADCLQVAGRYQEKLDPPFIPGREVAGVVEQVNSKDEKIKVGDQIIMLAEKDGWKSFVDVPIGYPALIKVPKSVDLKKAASLLVAYSTSHVALTHSRHGDLKKGQTVLVLGASGGVGLAACQIAHEMGCTVIAGASSEEKCKVCKEEGMADFTFNYSENKKDWFKKVLEFTKGKGCDVVYDPVGGDFTLQSIKCTKWGGVLLIIGFATSKIASIPANLLLVKNIRASGCYWGSYMKYEPHVLQQSMKDLFEMLLKGKINPLIGEVYPAEKIVQAMNDMLSRKTVGRVLISFGDERPSKL